MHTVELQNMDVGLTKYLFRSTYENDWLDILEYINVIATIFEPMEVLTDSKDDETEPVLATISVSDDIYAIPESDVVIVRGLNKLFNSVKFQIIFLKDSEEIQIYISTDDLEKVMEKELKKEFRPELINRIDEIIVFHKLENREIIDIAKIMLKQIEKRLEEKKYLVKIDDSVAEIIANSEIDKNYGARPLRRKIQELVEDRLSEEILQENIVRGKEFIFKL